MIRGDPGVPLSMDPLAEQSPASMTKIMQSGTAKHIFVVLGLLALGESLIERI